MAKDEESKTASGNEEQEVGERSTTPKGEPMQH